MENSTTSHHIILHNRFDLLHIAVLPGVTVRLLLLLILTGR